MVLDSVRQVNPVINHWSGLLNYVRQNEIVCSGLRMIRLGYFTCFFSSYLLSTQKHLFLELYCLFPTTIIMVDKTNQRPITLEEIKLPLMQYSHDKLHLFGGKYLQYGP